MNVLLDNELENMMCSVQPANVKNNIVSMVYLRKLETTKDLHCDDDDDDMGVMEA